MLPVRERRMIFAVARPVFMKPPMAVDVVRSWDSKAVVRVRRRGDVMLDGIPLETRYGKAISGGDTSSLHPSRSSGFSEDLLSRVAKHQAADSKLRRPANSQKTPVSERRGMLMGRRASASNEACWGDYSRRRARRWGRLQTGRPGWWEFLCHRTLIVGVPWWGN